MSSRPVIFSTQEDKDFPRELESRIKSDSNIKDPKLLLDYPTVYIHFWQSNVISYVSKGVTYTRQMYDIYIGESIDVIQRTKQHYGEGETANSPADAWQYDLVKSHVEPQFIVIGHKFFNKSFTLDIENRLIEYSLAMQKTVHKSINGRGNPQNSYFPSDEFNRIFSSIWKELMKIKPSLFISESQITNSSIFKASPLKKLTPEQSQAKDEIIQKVVNAYKTKKSGQLIFVQGEAGTGKTVLTTSTFYDLVNLRESDASLKDLSCHLMVNHNQQAKVYEEMVNRLGFEAESAGKPTKFINSHNPNEKVGVAFIDEGHLLWTQGKQSYRGNNQLQDIIDRAMVTVIMFDEYQVLNTEEYWEPEILQKFIGLSKKQGNYIELKHQLRMACSQSTINWINKFILNNTITEFTPDEKYDVRLFDSPASLHSAIKKLSSRKGCELSRVVATYDWNYIQAKRPEGKRFWDVCIGEWSMPWNYELEQTLSPKEKRAISHLAWAEQPQTIDEIGSTYTIQGFDLSYVGVILGPSVKYKDRRIIFDPTESKNEKATRNRTLSDNTQSTFGEIFIRNEVKVLLTRGVKGLFLYACDPELQNALKDIAKINCNNSSFKF